MHSVFSKFLVDLELMEGKEMDELTRKILEYDEAHFMCCFYENRMAIKDVLIQLYGLIAELEKKWNYNKRKVRC